MIQKGHNLLERDIPLDPCACMCMSLCGHVSVFVCCISTHSLNLTSNKSLQPSKVQLLVDVEPAGDLAEGLKGCASASVTHACAFVLHLCVFVMLCIVELTGKVGRGITGRYLHSYSIHIIYASYLLSLLPSFFSLSVLESPVNSSVSTKETDWQLNPPVLDSAT